MNGVRLGKEQILCHEVVDEVYIKPEVLQSPYKF
jgi:hypothetical protein